VMQTSPPVSPEGTLIGHVSRWTEVCGNRECRTGWLQLFRSRSSPRFEEKWLCSAACMERVITEAIRGQIESWEPAPTKRALRMPLGLILLSRGWISHRELQEALAAQRRAQEGRIGEWLRRLHGVSEETIAKALGIQWNCAVLRAGIPNLESASSLIPAFLRRRYGLAVLRKGPDGVLYLAGKYRAEHAVARAMEHMLREPVHEAFLADSEWSLGGGDAVDTAEIYLPGHDGVVALINDLVTRARPSDARLARVHDHLWLCMWLEDRGRRPMKVRNIVFPLRGRDGHELPQEMDCLEPAKNSLVSEL
jgi:hypothetical protein